MSESMIDLLVLDVGLGRNAMELQWLAREILPTVGIERWEAHGFEACADTAQLARVALADIPRVHVHHLAVSDREGDCILYHAVTHHGHSIFKTKCNVPPDAQQEVVPCSRLSVWLHANEPRFPARINLLRFNAEGAEWPLIEDLDSSGLLGAFQVVCGNRGGDIPRVQELASAGRYEQFRSILRRWGVDQFNFCHTREHEHTCKATMLARLRALFSVG